jgi:hypothetical protein
MGKNKQLRKRTTGVDPSGALKIQYGDGRPESLVPREVVEVK